ncbi:MAG TPA: helix-hairpin-helix domain-containing protein [Phycisphaerales bacterium]|jgi:competence ComEA-like helix-hairpin-helix protein|nr:helix-hairpin-helix domain-containing protein [Phycisphaerales bacterium]
MRGATDQQSFPGLAPILVLTAGALALSVWTALHRTSSPDEARAMHGATSWPDMHVNINSAGVAELALLPGVGERLAQRIVADRDERGPFASLHELERVPGMGAATIERLSPYAIASTE